MSASGEVRLKVVEASAEGCYCVHKNSLGRADTLWEFCHGARPAGNKETFRKYIKRQPMSIYRQPIHGLFLGLSCHMKFQIADRRHVMSCYASSDAEMQMLCMPCKHCQDQKMSLNLKAVCGNSP